MPNKTAEYAVAKLIAVMEMHRDEGIDRSPKMSLALFRIAELTNDTDPRSWPRVTDLAGHIRMSDSGAFRVVESLRKKGLVDRAHAHGGILFLTDKGKAFVDSIIGELIQ